MELEELFRSKLEGAELNPAANIRDNLMRRLGRREFLRFNPSRINIYYAGAVVAAGLVAGILLSTRPADNIKQNLTPPDKVKTVDSATVKAVSVQPGSEKTLVIRGAVENTTIEDHNGKSTGQNSMQNISTVQTGQSVNPASGRIDSSLKSIRMRDQVTSTGLDNLTLQKKILASFEVSSTAGCMPMKVKFINRSAEYDSSYWTFGDGGYSAKDNPEWIFDLQGEYRVLFTVFRKDGSESSYSQLITVYPKPVARFEISPESPIIPDDEIRFMNYSMDGVKCKWEFGDGKESDAWEPVYKYSHFDNFNLRLIVWSEHGCADSLTVLNAFAGSGSYIKFPNAFIPNPDGPAGGFYSSKSDEAAQIFHPVTSGVSDYQLRIFSKTGILIFESNDINLGWDGYNKGQLCEPGVYVWKVRGTYKNGEQFVKMGDVTLLKR